MFVQASPTISRMHYDPLYQLTESLYSVCVCACGGVRVCVLWNENIPEMNVRAVLPNVYFQKEFYHGAVWKHVGCLYESLFGINTAGLLLVDLAKQWRWLRNPIRQFEGRFCPCPEMMKEFFYVGFKILSFYMSPVCGCATPVLCWTDGRISSGLVQHRMNLSSDCSVCTDHLVN